METASAGAFRRRFFPQARFLAARHLKHEHRSGLGSKKLVLSKDEYTRGSCDANDDNLWIIRNGAPLRCAGDV
jgi:hypothetical protein